MPAKTDPADLSLTEHRRRVGHAVDAAIAATVQHPYLVATLGPVRELHDATPDELRSIVIVLMDRATQGGSMMDRVRGVVGGMPAGWNAAQVLGTLGSRRPPFSRGDVLLLLTMADKALRQAPANDEWLLITLVGQPVGAAERAVKSGGLGEVEGPIRDLADGLGRFREYSVAQAARYRARLVALLQAGQPATGAGAAGGALPSIDPSLIDTGDTWGQGWRPRVAGLPSGQGALFAHLPLAGGVTPSASWRRRAGELAQADGSGDLLRAMLGDALTSESTVPPKLSQYGDQVFVVAQPPIGDANVLILRGAIWAAATLGEPWVPGTLTTIGLHFGTSGGSSNVARDERLANTAAAALGSLSGPEAIAGLGRLKAKVTNRNVSKQIAKALEAAAGRSGVTASELLELAVPTHGLDRDGRREIPIGNHVALLAIDGDDVVLTWRAPDGRPSARPPVAIAGEAAAIAKAKEEHKELRKALGLERGRIEDLFVEDREWSLPDWRARYLAHPLTRTIARRLIWVFLDGDRSAAAMPEGDGFAAADGSAVAPGPEARVRLWHPIEAPETEIAAWRTRLLGAQLRQPFKQAFREVYLLTPAEEETETYSNRFAAHILRYPQARALMTVRRWGSNFLGPYDGGFNGVARREFPSQGLRAEFWHDALDEELQADPGTADHCTTDQVRFVRVRPGGDAIPLRDVPWIVFSEAMRDVDLFVSVTSIGADRNWQDGGQDRGNLFDGYWTTVWDQPLTATAAVRRDVLERMIPGLAIADGLELQDRWLQVRGDLRTYRIHLGSGNILMAPSDTYLCIVPARGGVSERLFLPFDDDPTLSVILSKAFLLARDSKITDRSIVAQIRRG